MYANAPEKGANMIQGSMNGDTRRWRLLTGVICLALPCGLIAVNCFLPFPDIVDFFGLGELCLLMDADIKYCVNNNWGFAHPLSCWLLTKITGDLLISQRILNSLFIMISATLLVRIVRYSRVRLSKASAGCLLLFVSSPWAAEAAVSVSHQMSAN